jgi:hypothetical protein
MDGSDVAAWQLILQRDGLSLGPAGVDGKYRGATRTATTSWQRSRGVPRDELGTVGPATRARIGTHAEVPTLRGLAFPTLPYLEAANWSREIGVVEKDQLVLHTMEAPEKGDTAEACARWFHKQSSARDAKPRSSAHACVDDDSVVVCVPWNRIAWHAPGANRRGIGLELAGYARQTAEQWTDAYSLRVLDRAAWLTAELSFRHPIPIRDLTVEGLLAGEPGITTHGRVSRAFRKSTHTDPGAHFPMARFLDTVTLYAELIGRRPHHA